MDIQMPLMDGLTAARAIRQLHGPASQVHIVALTANAMLDEREAHLQAGMDDHLSKPVDVHKLSALLLRVAQRRAVAAAPPDPVADLSVLAPSSLTV